VQHPLPRADRGRDAASDDSMAYVAEHPGHPDGVLIVDAAGFFHHHLIKPVEIGAVQALSGAVKAQG
jgi:hypothetical protein